MADDVFGFDVSISGDYAIVSAHLDDDLGVNSGSAYIFRRDGTSWLEEAKLTASDGDEEDIFAYSVSVSGVHALVGAFGDEPNGAVSGSAYLYRRDGTSWTEQAKLVPVDSDTGDLFGYSVALSGDDALVGAPQWDFPLGPGYTGIFSGFGGVAFVEPEVSIPRRSELFQNYPNPFNPSTTFSYGLAEPGQVSLTIYNMLGQLIRTVVDEHQVEGYHEVAWDGRNEVGAAAASGIYVCRMIAENHVETKRMILIK